MLNATEYEINLSHNNDRHFAIFRLFSLEYEIVRLSTTLIRLFKFLVHLSRSVLDLIIYSIVILSHPLSFVRRRPPFSKILFSKTVSSIKKQVSCAASMGRGTKICKYGPCHITTMFAKLI